MMRSMFSGVSGLRAHQTRMDVIGNNIANVNTVGFKSSRVTFQEVFSQTIRGSSAPDNATGQGGTNPMQIGLGISVGSIDNLFTPGSEERTNNPNDVSIAGEGFFIVRGNNAESYKFSRAGNITQDDYGNLMIGSMRLYGWQTRKEGSKTEFDTEQALQPLNLFTDPSNGNKRVLGATETTSAKFSGNLDCSYAGLDSANPSLALPGAGSSLADIENAVQNTPDIETFTVPYKIYDKLGNDYTISVTFVKNEVDGSTTEWFWYSDDGTDPPAQGIIAFDGGGEIINDMNTHPIYPVENELLVTPSADKGTDPFTVVLDFSNLTQYNSQSSVKATQVDGYPPGEYVGHSIGADGVITALYTNNQQQALGMIALAYFENPAGLEKIGGNLYLPTSNSGDFQKGYKPGSASVGKLKPGTLEMSNVDLAKEFTDMITTQRGFQANSRIITTSDEMLQELVNLKR